MCDCRSTGALNFADSIDLYAWPLSAAMLARFVSGAVVGEAALVLIELDYRAQRVGLNTLFAKSED